MLDPTVVVTGGLPQVECSIDEIGMLTVDIQRMCADPAFDFRRESAQFIDEGARYFQRLEETVVPNTATVQSYCRQNNIPVVHVRIAAHRQDLGDLSWRYRALGMGAVVGSPETEFLPGVAPVDGETVFNKTTSSAFVSTSLDFHLRNLGIKALIVAGVASDGCVESTVRHGADLGYQFVILEDACAAYRFEAHAAAMQRMNGSRGHVMTAMEAVRNLEGMNAMSSRS